MKNANTFGVIARPKAPAGYIGRWVNIYHLAGEVWLTGGAYSDRAVADRIAKKHRHSCVYTWIKLKYSAEDARREMERAHGGYMRS